MKHMFLFGQVAFIAALGGVISPPQFSRPARPVKVWRANGPLAPRPELVSADARLAYAPDAASRARYRATVATTRDDFDAPGVASGSTNRAYGALIARITGRARNAMSQPVAFAELVLRSLETGEVVATATADENGEFTFDDLRPMGYVVELLGADGSVIAASEMVAATSGGIQEANIRLSGNGTPRAVFGGITRVANGNVNGGNAMTASASEVVGRAARRGVTQTQQPQTTASPRL